MGLEVWGGDVESVGPIIKNCWPRGVCYRDRRHPSFEAVFRDLGADKPDQAPAIGPTVIAHYSASNTNFLITK